MIGPDDGRGAACRARGRRPPVRSADSEPRKSGALGEAGRPYLALVVLLLLAGCASPSGSPASGADQPTEGRPSVTKRLTAAIRGDPHTVYQKLNPRSNIPGIDDLERLVNTGLTIPSGGSGRLARLAEVAPSVDNGLWKLLPDGQMEMTWTLRQGVVWQDGAPVTSEDLLFTIEVVRDKDLPIFGHIAYDSLGTVDARDARTVVARWTQPYIKADELFSFSIALPIPKHLLDQTYRTDKEHFLDHPYWSTEFIGTGPYKIKEWERGSHLVFQANDRYLLGRPRIDELRVRFIPDPNTLAANILAGEVEVTLGGRIDIEWAMTVQDQWKDGRMDVAFRSMIQIFPQFINPTPPTVLDPQFRRALVHALDRQQMVNELQFGLTSVGHTFVSPQEPQYPSIESSIIKYDYDQRKALQMLESLGYTRGPDGMLRDRSGQKLTFQIRTSQGDQRQEKAMYVSADDWQRLGIDVERHLVPPQRAGDAEYRSTFPAFDLKGQAGTMDYATSYHSSRVALPENSYRVSGNNARYRHPDLDAAIDRYYTTIPWNERMQAAAEIVRHVSDQVVWMGLFHLAYPQLFTKRLTQVASTDAGRSEILDSVHLWDLE